MGRDKRRARNTYPRRKLRAELKGFFRDERRSLAGLSVLVAALLGSTLWQPSYFQGLTMGAVVCVSVGMILFAFAVRTHAWDCLCGAWAEDNTREAVDAAQRSGHVWRQVSSIESGGSDIDHVVIAPAEIVTIESKWLFRAPTNRALKSYADQSLRATLKLRSILRSERVVGVTSIATMVVLWGKGRACVPTGAAWMHGVLFVDGGRLSEVLSWGRTGPIGRDWADDTYTRLQKFADSQVRKPVVT